MAEKIEKIQKKNGEHYKREKKEKGASRDLGEAEHKTGRG